MAVPPHTFTSPQLPAKFGLLLQASLKSSYRSVELLDETKESLKMGKVKDEDDDSLCNYHEDHLNKVDRLGKSDGFGVSLQADQTVNHDFI